MANWRIGTLADWRRPSETRDARRDLRVASRGLRPLRGQTLLELIIALGVVLAGVLGMLTLVFSSINASRRATEQIIAQNLAREGIELVRSVRDSNWLDPGYPTSPDTWDRDLVVSNDPTAAPIVAANDYIGGNSGLDYAANVQGDGATRIGLRGNAYVQPYITGDIDTKYARLLTFYRICWDNASDEKIVANPNSTCGAEFGVGYNPVGLKVVSEVKWPPTGIFTRKVTLEERLYNWRP